MNRKTLLLKSIFFIFSLFLFSSDILAYQTCQTSGGADLKWTTQNLTVYLNTAGGPSNSLSALQASMQTWTDVSSSSFAFVYGGATTSTAYGANDSSYIAGFSPMGLNGTLAETSIWYNTASGQLYDTDLQFNTSYQWGTDGSSAYYDVQNIGTHELGHFLCLDDLYSDADSEKTMYGYASAGETKKRTLEQDDINGIAYLYPSGEGDGGGGGGTPGCTYSLSTTYLSFTSNGGSGSVSVSTLPGCTWSASSNVTWITITSGTSGSGGGTVGFSVSSNSTSSYRIGNLTIANQTVTIIQTGSIQGTTMNLPAAKNSYSYPAVSSSVKSTNPSDSRPVGVGSIASGGGTLSLQVGLNQLAGPADIYLGILLPDDPHNLYILRSDGTFQAISSGLVPWKSSTAGPVTESLFGNIPAIFLSQGTYYIYLAVTSDNFATYYLWETYFTVP